MAVIVPSLPVCRILGASLDIHNELLVIMLDGLAIAALGTPIGSLCAGFACQLLQAQLRLFQSMSQVHHTSKYDRSLRFSA